MRLLITGGCGFIGSNFIRLLLDKHPQYSLVNLDKLTYAGNLASLQDVVQNHPDRYVFAHGDIADSTFVANLFDSHKPDAVINFAAESHVDRSIADASPFITTNVLGTQTLLDQARKAGVKRFVQVSTDEVYGTLGPQGKFREDTPLAPNSPYSASKAGADMLVRAAHETFGLATVTTRCSNNYGPYQFPEKLIPLMIGRAMQDQSLPVYGDGLQIRDWIHVEDHCQGILLALEKGKAGAVYNFGGNAEMPNIDVVKTLLRLCGKSETLIRHVADRPGHDRRYAMDYSLAERELGYSPKWTFERGIAQTVDWYKNNAAWVEGITSGAYLDFMKQWYAERLA